MQLPLPARRFQLAIPFGMDLCLSAPPAYPEGVTYPIALCSSPDGQRLYKAPKRMLVLSVPST